jgi:hypothetical protein
MKQIVNVNALQEGCSILSKKSYVIIVVKVLNKPALIPFGGSLVTFRDVCNSPRGNSLCGSVVIQSLNSS